MNDPAGSSGAGGMDNLEIAKNALKPYISNSNDVVEFKLVKRQEDLEDDATSFPPEMSHQIFGENESIFGYRDLQIKIYCSAAKLTTYLSVGYSDKVNPSRFDGVEPDDVEKAVAEKIEPGYLTNMDDFVTALDKDEGYLPHGELLHSFTADVVGEDDCPVSRKYEVYTCDISTPRFRSFHERLQPFLLWFVDASSYIDVDDERWRFFTVWEKYFTGSSHRYAIAGYGTVYEYYAYPAHIRPRISQMLILPPFQRQGVGSQLLETIYKYYIPQDSVLDITVEDPSEEFTRLRDFYDVRRCKDLDCFQPECLQKGFSQAMTEAARKKYKMNKRQTRRIYEILRLGVTNKNDPESYRNYRLDVKNRLNQPFEKNKRDFKKLQQQLKTDELQAVMGLDKDQRIAALNRMYQDLEVEYQHILDRLE